MDVYEALADPTRREIVATLSAGERSAGDLAARFEMAGPSVSRHLKVLRESGLIAYRQQATSRVYRLEPERLEEVRQWMEAVLDATKARFDRLGAHLDQMKALEEGDD
jgi:DNA-binding transcriptional ArsR family regulator